MKKLKQAVILFILTMIVVLMINQNVFAAKNTIDVKSYIHKVDFSKEFEAWMKLSEEEKENTVQPRMYDDLNTTFTVQNPLYQVNLLGTSMNAKYNLKDVIPENVTIRNQYDTNLCWGFAGLSSLETNLAMENYKLNKNTDKVYDFSERHMNYATTRSFANGVENEYGFHRNASSGGQWFLVENYLTNGQGAINESEMPFENNDDLIEIGEIQNKIVASQVYDTIYFDNYNEKSGSERTDAMNQIKQHIQNYGSVFASIHGNSSNSSLFDCYYNDTGAKYCDDVESHTPDHAVAIIGWDDNYSTENFAENAKPSSNGAWIIRNSWGENVEYSLTEFKEELFHTYTEQCQSLGWNSAEVIPNEFIESAGYTISGNTIYMPVGDKGYMYVSYEDCNIASTVYGIIKATDSVAYDYIYQYNELYPALEMTLNAPSTYLCNIFDKQSSRTEYLTEVSLTVPETYTCKVYVNPNGTGKSKSDLQFVALKAGESETLDKGYHTLEFAEPIEIKSNQFAVAIEIQGTRTSVDILMEGKVDGVEMFDVAKTETGKCFIASSNDLNSCIWFDLGKLNEAVSSLPNGDSSIKAFTVSKIENHEEPSHVEEPVEPAISKEEKAVNSNMSNSSCNLTKVQAYYFTSDSSKDYTLVDVEITGIARNLTNDSYEYAYYLSPDGNLKSITDWVKITDKQTASNQLTFRIDSRDVPNYDEISKATNLYIYIKETAVKGENQSISISKAMKFEQGNNVIETYVDNAKKQDYNGVNVSNQDNADSSSETTPESSFPKNEPQGQTSNTTSPTKLPYTGNTLLIVGIVVICILGIAIFIRYEVLNRYIK